jgi:hypothetical protein
MRASAEAACSGGDKLERDLGIELEVAGDPHGAHASPGERPLQAVFPSDDRAFGDMSHHALPPWAT